MTTEFNPFLCKAGQGVPRLPPRFYPQAYFPSMVSPVRLYNYPFVPVSAIAAFQFKPQIVTPPKEPSQPKRPQPATPVSAPTSSSDSAGEPKDSIDRKLDSILATVRKQSKDGKKQLGDKANKKGREKKSREQLDILKKEVENGGSLDKDRLGEIALRTRLRKSQVYKWYWDNKKKNKSPDQ